MCPMLVTECLHNKCLNCQPCVQFIFSPGCESDMILSVMTVFFAQLKTMEAKCIANAKANAHARCEWDLTAASHVINFVYKSFHCIGPDTEDIRTNLCFWVASLVVYVLASSLALVPLRQEVWDSSLLQGGQVVAHWTEF